MTASDSSARAAGLRKKNAPLLLAERARATPHDIAYRAKKLGIYKERTWADFAQQVGRVARALQQIGLKRGDRLAIMGDAFEEYAICDMAAQAVGAVTYGIYPTASATEVAYQLQNGGAKFFIAENQEYVDKVLGVLDGIPSLEHVVVVDDSAMFAYEHSVLTSYSKLLGTIEVDGDAALVALESLAKAIDPSDPAFIIYTSGTTGFPKGALVSHGNHLAAAHTFVELYPLVLDKDQRTVVYLPLCHILGRVIAITLPLLSGVVPHYGESVNELQQTLFEVAPTVLITVPRYLQKFASQVLVSITDASPLKRFVYNHALRYGRTHARKRWEGTVDRRSELCYCVAHAIAFRPMLNKLGFDQLRLVISGGAPLPAETAALWQIYGVNVLEVYGQTETAGAMICGQRGPFPRPGNVGAPPTGWEVQLAEDGEVLVRSEDLFVGYWEDKDATAGVLDADGWLHTGDVAEWQSGGLRLIDRSRDFIVTDGGKTISPSHIENIVRVSSYMAEVVVIGQARKYLTALIEIEYDTVSQWARSNNIVYAGYTALTQHVEVHKLLQREIETTNQQLSRAEQIKAFRILPKMLDPEEEGEPVTPTRKVKRKLMHDRFADLIESMYDNAEARRVTQSAGDILA